MKTSILVTGGAGYLGSTLVPLLLQKDFKVTVIDNFMFGQSSLNQLCINPDFRIINGDVRVKDTMRKVLKDADYIIPLAAFVGAPLCKKDPIGATSVNKDAITLMLNLISPDQRVIMPTTNSAYGTGDENNQCTEDSPLRPISQYAIEKVEVEEKIMELKNFISFRLATVFGMSPRMRLDLLVNDFTYRAHYDRFIVLFESHFKRNYIHVRDVAKAFIHAIDNYDVMNSNIYNVGLSDANISKYDLCVEIQKYIKDFTFIDAEVGKDPDQRNYIVSNSKIEGTGYMPDVTLQDGIQELIKGFEMIKNTKYGNV
jgi:nucleoside-diphosphate-sugar epimerase